MKALTAALVSLALLSLGGCAQNTKVAILKLDSRISGGGETNARIDVPGEWYQDVRKLDRAEFVGPDNFSRITLVAAPTALASEGCRAFSKRIAEDLTASLGAATGARPELQQGEEGVDFKLRLIGKNPAPTDRVVVGRTTCHDGGVATVTCSVGVNRESTIGSDCQKVISSFKVTPVSPPLSSLESVKQQGLPAEKMDRSAQ